MTLTIARLIHSTSWERNAHRSVLQEIAEQRYRSPTEARARAAALGLPAADASFLAVLVDTPRSATEVETLLSQTLERTALVGTFTDQRVGVLLFLRRGQPWQSAVELLSRAARAQDAGVVVSVGCEVTDLAHVARSFREAGRVAEAVLPGSTDRLFYQLSDIGLRHLLHTLRDDIRVQDYVERQIGRLVEHDARHGTELLPTLRHYLDAAGNKTIAARRGGISRQTLYERLRLLERLLERDLEAGEHRTELHVALLLLDVLRG